MNACIVCGLSWLVSATLVVVIQLSRAVDRGCCSLVSATLVIIIQLSHVVDRGCYSLVLATLVVIIQLSYAVMNAVLVIYSTEFSMISEPASINGQTGG